MAVKERAKVADVAITCFLQRHRLFLAVALTGCLPPQLQCQAAEAYGAIPVRGLNWKPAALPPLLPWPQIENSGGLPPFLFIYYLSKPSQREASGELTFSKKKKLGSEGERKAKRRGVK